MLTKIFKYIFRKKSLNSAIYILVAAIIREAIALGYDETFEELFKKFSNEYDSYEVDVLVLILQIIFTKGSWITLLILIGVLLVLLLFRYGGQILPAKKRPRIDFHKIYAYSRRKPLAITKNNPKVIRVGIDKVERQWELTWDYNVEVRNNSTVPAYEFTIDFENKPPNAHLKSEIGKFEPIKVHEVKEVKFSLTVLYVGYHDGADEIINDPVHPLLKDLIIIGKYKDEERNQYITEYNWSSDQNRHK